MSKNLRESINELLKWCKPEAEGKWNFQSAIEHVEAALKEDDVNRQKVFEVIDTVKAQYPTSVFPDNGTSPDAKAGMMARLICDNTKREMEIMFNEELLPQPPTRVIEGL